MCCVIVCVLLSALGAEAPSYHGKRSSYQLTVVLPFLCVVFLLSVSQEHQLTAILLVLEPNECV